MVLEIYVRVKNLFRITRDRVLLLLTTFIFELGTYIC